MSMSFLSEDALANWVIENSPRRIPIASRMPFEGIEGDDLHVNPLSTDSLPEGVVQTSAAPISDQASAPAGTQRKYPINFLPQYVEVDQPDPVSGTVRAPMLALHGTPWYVNDFMDDPEPNYSNRIYFMVLGDNGKPGDGRGITGIVPKRNLGNFFIRRESTPDAENICVDYTWPVGVASGSLGALSAYDFTP